MAAPAGTDILDVTGEWLLNRDLSDSLESTFELQGIPWIIRRVINVATLTLSFQQDLPENEDSPIRFSVKQAVRPGGFDAENEYILDGQTRYDTVPIFGEVSATNSYITRKDISKEDLLGWEVEDIEGEDRVGIVEVVSGVHTGWVSRTLWAFEVIAGERYLCKYATTTKDERTVTARMVFDYLGMPDGM